MKASVFALALASLALGSAADAQMGFAPAPTAQTNACGQMSGPTGGAATAGTTRIMVINDTAYPVVSIQTASTRSAGTYGRELVPNGSQIPSVDLQHPVGGRVELDFSARGGFFCEPYFDAYSNRYYVRVTFMTPQGPLQKVWSTVVDVCRTQSIRTSAFL